MKKFLCVLLAFLLTFSGMNINLHAEEDPSETEITETSEVEEEEIPEEVSEEVEEEPEPEETIEDSEGESEEEAEDESEEEFERETEEESEEVIEEDGEQPEEEPDEEIIEEEPEEEIEETEDEEDREEVDINEDPFFVSEFRTSSDYLSGMIALSDSDQLIHAEKYAEYEKTIVIDVSEYQGTIDWSKVKGAGVEYAIIRVGYRGWNTGKLVEDNAFSTNISNAVQAGVKVVLYFFSQAVTADEAMEEAQFVLDRIHGAAISLPVFIDQEFVNNNEDRLYTSNLSREQMTANAQVFCQKIASAGYQAGLYASASFLENRVNASTISAQYNVWVAHHANQTNYAGDYGFWQYGKGVISGINGSVDMNVMYTKAAQDNIEADTEPEPETDPEPEMPVVEGALTYQAHVQDIGWQSVVGEKKTAGTTGRAKQLEAIKIMLPDSLSSYGSVSYRAHVQDIGWQKTVTSGAIAGTVGRAKQMEAIEISLTGSLKDEYDIYYRAHVKNIGWQPWKKNGAMAGTTGKNLRMEAIQIYITKKNSGPTPEPTPEPTPQPDDKIDLTKITYQAKVKTNGWTSAAKNGYVAGTTGKALRMEALKITLPSSMTKLGNISLSAHVSDIGWQKAVNSGGTAGVTNGSQQIEAVKLSLTGTLAQQYDVYYHVHVSDIGWMGWAKNGEISGTTGLAKAVEAIQILFVPKGSSSSPGRGSTVNSIKVATSDLYYKQHKPSVYYQYDSRWASMSNGGYTINASGCVPTAIAMALNGILGTGITPPTVANWLYNNTMEYCRIKHGGSELAVKYAAEHYGVKCVPLTSQSQMTECLKKGYIVVMGVGPGLFTIPGYTHEIVVYGHSGNSAIVNDPASSAKTGKYYSISTIWSQRTTNSYDLRGGYVGYALYK